MTHSLAVSLDLASGERQLVLDMVPSRNKTQSRQATDVGSRWL